MPSHWIVLLISKSRRVTRISRLDNQGGITIFIATARPDDTVSRHLKNSQAL
jgi:hypothetical protein